MYNLNLVRIGGVTLSPLHTACTKATETVHLRTVKRALLSTGSTCHAGWKLPEPAPGVVLLELFPHSIVRIFPNGCHDDALRHLSLHILTCGRGRMVLAMSHQGRRVLCAGAIFAECCTRGFWMTNITYERIFRFCGSTWSRNCDHGRSAECGEEQRRAVASSRQSLRKTRVPGSPLAIPGNSALRERLSQTRGPIEKRLHTVKCRISLGGVLQGGWETRGSERSGTSGSGRDWACRPQKEHKFVYPLGQAANY